MIVDNKIVSLIFYIAYDDSNDLLKSGNWTILLLISLFFITLLLSSKSENNLMNRYTWVNTLGGTE